MRKNVRIVAAPKGVRPSSDSLIHRPWMTTSLSGLRVVNVGKLWDLLDYGLAELSSRPRGSSLLARSGEDDAESGLNLLAVTGPEIEGLFEDLSRLDMRALSREAWSLDDFWAVPENEDELEELRDEIVELLIFALENDLVVFVVQ